MKIHNELLLPSPLFMHSSKATEWSRTMSLISGAGVQSPAGTTQLWFPHHLPQKNIHDVIRATSASTKKPATIYGIVQLNCVKVSQSPLQVRCPSANSPHNTLPVFQLSGRSMSVTAIIDSGTYRIPGWWLLCEIWTSDRSTVCQNLLCHPLLCYVWTLMLNPAKGCSRLIINTWTFSVNWKQTPFPHKELTTAPLSFFRGPKIPLGWIFPFSKWELGTLKEYYENLKKEFIRPSTSPAGDIL